MDLNPYNFIRFGEPGLKKAVLPHDRFYEGTYSGRLTCQLFTLTHLFVPETQDRPDRRQHQTLQVLRGSGPLLPGSSIKGVLRSVSEALSGSCMLLPSRYSYPTKTREYLTYKLPRDFENCQTIEHACPACRIFGFLGKGEKNLHAGKISLEDAHVVNEAEMEWVTITALMEPKPRHRLWYGDSVNPSQVRGRKFYFHRPQGPQQTTTKNEFNKTIEAVKPGVMFKFTIDYTNLTEDELALLVFALALEEPMRHKFGMGKPVGLGSTEVAITEWEKHDRLARYKTFGSGTTMVESAALDSEVDTWRQLYHHIYSRWQASFEDLRRIWTWNPASAAEIKYPTQQWFKDNPQVPLQQAP